MRRGGKFDLLVEEQCSRAAAPKTYVVHVDDVNTDGLRIWTLHDIPTSESRIAAVELYHDSNLPPVVKRFVDSHQPRLSTARAPAQSDGPPLDDSLVSEGISQWTPIPIADYATEGSRINPLNTARIGLLHSLARRFRETGRREYAERAWEVLASIIEQYDRHQGFRFLDGDAWLIQSRPLSRRSSSGRRLRQTVQSRRSTPWKGAV